MKKVLALTLFSGCAFFSEYEDDNAYEEALESIIDYKTGIQIDLTPNTPEDHDRNRFVPCPCIADIDESFHLLVC